MEKFIIGCSIVCWIGGAVFGWIGGGIVGAIILPLLLNGVLFVIALILGMIDKLTCSPLISTPRC